MPEPIWIELSDIRDAVDLAATLALRGVRVVPVAAGDRAFVRVPASAEAPLQDVLALVDSLEVEPRVRQAIRLGAGDPRHGGQGGGPSPREVA